MYKLSIAELLFNVVLWLIFLLIYKNQFHKRTKSNHGFGPFVIVVIFSTFGFSTGDYFHYKELYNQIVSTTSLSQIHLEDFYFWLIKNLPESYSLWRFAVWGPSTLIFVLLAKRMKLNPQFTGLVFALILFVYFAAPRNTLGYVMLYWGVAFILFPKDRKSASRLIGILIIIASSFFHKSMGIYIALIGIALIPLNKWIYIISLLAFPFLYKYAITIVSFILPNFIHDDESSLSTGMQYLESTNYSSANIFGLLQFAIWRIPLIILLIYPIYNIFFKKESIAYGYKVFLNYTYILIYISFLFYEQQTSGSLSPRFWDAATYTATIFIAYYYHNRPSQMTTRCFYMMILANLYNFAYSFYKL